MKPRTAKSMELYEMMLHRDYPEPFCDQITRNQMSVVSRNTYPWKMTGL